MIDRLLRKSIQVEHGNNYPSALEVRNFNVWFGKAHILKDISVDFERKKINCIIGPSGSGKSTLIRSINRINDEEEEFRHKGAVYFEGKNIYEKSVDVTHLRKEIGMVFQKPCVFPKSISENVLFGIQHIKRLSKPEKVEILEDALKAVSLWEEVSDRLADKACSLSIGQQQRLSVARTLSIRPNVLLLDEPTSSLDPVSTRTIDNLMLSLKRHYTIVFVTHSIHQARRIADKLIFMCDGRIIEQGQKEKLLCEPEKEQTKRYLDE